MGKVRPTGDTRVGDPTMERSLDRSSTSARDDHRRCLVLAEVHAVGTTTSAPALVMRRTELRQFLRACVDVRQASAQELREHDAPSSRADAIDTERWSGAASRVPGRMTARRWSRGSLIHPDILDVHTERTIAAGMRVPTSLELATCCTATRTLLRAGCHTGLLERRSVRCWRACV